MIGVLQRAATTGVEACLAPMDGLRAQLYRLGGPLVAPWVKNRELRAAILGAIAVAVALAASTLVPLWLLAVGPIVLGVPHVIGDVRYLWVQPGFHKQRAVWLCVVPLLLAGGITGRVAWGFAAALVALFAVPCSWRRRAVGTAVLLPLAALAAHWSTLSTLLFAHLHNFIAVGLWWALWPRQARWHLGLVALYVAVCALLLLGALDGVVAAGAGWLGGDLAGRGLYYHARSLAPFATPELGARIAVLFAFAQSIHYAIWLRLIPEQARMRPSPRPFRSSYRALAHELGTPLLWLFAITALVFAVWAVVDLWAARDGYLRSAVFHGHLELAAAALLFAGGRRLAPGA